MSLALVLAAWLLPVQVHHGMETTSSAGPQHAMAPASAHHGMQVASSTDAHHAMASDAVRPSKDPDAPADAPHRHHPTCFWCIARVGPLSLIVVATASTHDGPTVSVRAAEEAEPRGLAMSSGDPRAPPYRSRSHL